MPDASLTMRRVAGRSMPTAPAPLMEGRGAPAPFRIALFVAWFGVALWLASTHVFWRDEVRALTIALSGDSLPAMLRNLQGEGHPALWYLLLRGAHALTGAKQVLPGVAFAIGVGAAALFAFRAPFRPIVLLLAMGGAFFLREYTVLARNYGMSMLVMFAWATLYPRWKERGFGLGLLLALLCNTNVPSVIVAGALGLFWGVEIATEQGWRWGPAWRRWTANMAIAAVGVALCALEVYPPAHDAAVSPLAGRMSVGTLLMAAGNVTAPFSALMSEALWGVPLVSLLFALLLVGSPLGLLRSPGGLLAALAVLWALPMFFQLVYPGGYRHQALLLALLLTLYWLVAEGGGGRWPDRRPMLRPATAAALRRGGQACFAALLFIQVVMSIGLVTATANGLVYSRSAALADLLRRQRLEQAVVIADSDVLVEPLAYYAPNPTWLVRAGRWGRVVPFTKANAGDLRVARILSTARALRHRTGQPVVILMQTQLDPNAAERTHDQGILGTLTTEPGEVRAFLDATRRIAAFPPAETDESYDVYLLR